MGSLSGHSHNLKGLESAELRRRGDGKELKLASCLPQECI